MKRPILLIALFVLIQWCFTACDKKENTNPGNGEVELFLLDSYKTVGSTNQIDEKTVVTQASPLVAYSDIQSYDSRTCTFKLSDRAKEDIKNLEHSVHGIAFAVKANNVLVYTGYFWPSYSSASCDWVVADPGMLLLGNEISVRLGYPGLHEGQIIPDKRNDQRILDIFASDGKLIE
jgi:predicted small secreted protein